MKFTVLGSGTSIPHPTRGSAGYWLETSGGTVLLDLSAHALRRMADMNLDWPNLDAIWISHFHLDHVGGLAPFLAGTKHSDQMQKREKPLRIFGSQGVKGLLERFDNVNKYKLFEQPFPLEIVEIEPLEEFEIVKGATAVAMSTPHTEESCAIHIRDADDSSLVYTADTGFDESIATFARKVDLLVIEASYPKDKPQKKHLELAQAMFIIRKAEPTRAVLTHLYPMWDDVDFEKEVAKFDPRCVVVKAVDGMKLDIPE